MTDRKQSLEGFTNPTATPASPDQAHVWQAANRAWWESHPMRYDWKEAVKAEEFSREFYEEIDERFFSKAKEFMPWRKIPFDTLIDFESLADKDVLEIGVGNGSHALLLAQHARAFTGIDLTDYAVKSTSERLRLSGIRAQVVQMDAERLSLPDNSFDFVWSWGVIHHSANPQDIIKAMGRVLRPGGRAITMVYYRSWWSYYGTGALVGLRTGMMLKTRSLHASVQQRTDGALARFYSIGEWKRLVSHSFRVERIGVYGPKSDIVPLPAGRLKGATIRLFPDELGQFLTNRLRMGSLLVSVLAKTSDTEPV